MMNPARRNVSCQLNLAPLLPWISSGDRQAATKRGNARTKTGFQSNFTHQTTHRDVQVIGEDEDDVWSPV